MLQIRNVYGASATLVLALGLGCGSGPSEDGGGTSEASSTDAGDSTGDPPQASLLELCDAPAPCDPFDHDPGSNGEGVDPRLECALGRVLDSLADASAVELTSSYCDIGCGGTDVLLVGDGIAYVQAWSSTADVSYAPIGRCSLQAASFFDACLGQPWSSGGCASWGGWVTDCETVETVQCP